MIEVFVEVAAGSVEKRRFDDQTLAYVGSLVVAVPYPFPYGFIPGTRSEDGDAVDCYVITERPLDVGSTVTCVPVGLLEQREDGEPDHKILAVLPGETASLAPAIETLRGFIRGVFAGFPDTNVELGELRGADAAEAHILARRSG